MNMTECSTELTELTKAYPGQQLAQARVDKGLSLEYVASRLHLRVRVVESLEADAYDLLPQFVFVQGYVRAYAKLLGMPAEPLLAQYSSLKEPETKQYERILRQQKREPIYREVAWRLMLLIATFICVMSAYYWFSHHESVSTNEHNKMAHASTPSLEVAQPRAETLIDLSNMESTTITAEKQPLRAEVR